MTEARFCPECQVELPADAPQGLCPKCLFQQALSGSDNGAEGGEAPGTHVYQNQFVPPPPEALAQHFPQLEILELLGQGGMGAVYKARQKKLDRLVALKILPPVAGRDPAFAERFAREAKALARLSHPNIVAVHDFGEVDGLFFFVMEYVDGANLRQLMQAGLLGKRGLSPYPQGDSPLFPGRLEPQEALRIIPQVCDALQYAHEEEIVHRDIKPENILLDVKGRVKIADFGLAKLLGRTPVGFTLTGSQQIMGTPHYMAPEQMEKPHTVDHRADIYSLGVVFYEMLTGELPLGRFALPSEKAPVDGRLDDVVIRTLAKEPDQRYQRVSEMKVDVESIARGNAPLGAWPASAAAEFLQVDREAIRHRLLAPAAGLLFTGLLSFANYVVAGIALLSIPAISEFMAHNSFSRDAISFLGVLALVVVAGASGIIVVGAIKMMRLESYSLAKIASIWAMLPWSYAFFIGLPFGIWALRVLRKPEVRAAFLGQTAIRSSAGPAPQPAKGFVLGKVASMVRSVRSLVWNSSPRQMPTRADGPALLGPNDAKSVAQPSGAFSSAGPAQPRLSPAPRSPWQAAAPRGAPWILAASPPAPPQDSKPFFDRWGKTGRDAFVVGAILGSLVLVGMVAAGTQTKIHLYASLLIAYLLTVYSWSSQTTKLIGGISAYVAMLVLVGVGWGKYSDPFWVGSLIPFALAYFAYEFATSFKKGKSTEDDDDSEAEGSQISGLSEQEELIWRRLKKFAAEMDLSVMPDIDAELLSACRKVCQVPAAERILALIDFTGNESGDSVLLFGCRGIYFHHDKRDSKPGPGCIPYDEFPLRVFANHGKEIYLGNDQYLQNDPDESQWDSEYITNMFNAVRDIITARKPHTEKAKP